MRLTCHQVRGCLSLTGPQDCPKQHLSCMDQACNTCVVGLFTTQLSTQLIITMVKCKIVNHEDYNWQEIDADQYTVLVQNATWCLQLSGQELPACAAHFFRRGTRAETSPIQPSFHSKPYAFTRCSYSSLNAAVLLFVLFPCSGSPSSIPCRLAPQRAAARHCTHYNEVQ